MLQQLIGAPLIAAVDASMQLAQSAADFSNKFGFDEQGKVRTTTFKYQKHSVNEHGTPEGLQRVLDMMSEALTPHEPKNNSEGL